MTLHDLKKGAGPRRGWLTLVVLAAPLALWSCRETPTSVLDEAPLELAANCAKNPTHPHCADEGGGSGGGDPAETPFALTFRDDPSDNIRSDGGGIYNPGADGFDSAVGPDVAGVGGASWVLDSSSRHGPANRTYCVIVPGLFDAPGICSHGNFRTTQHSDPDGVAGMEIGETLRAKARFFFYPGDGYQYNVRFACNESGSDDSSCENWVDVTRTATGWTVTGHAAGFIERSTVKGKPQVTQMGGAVMPFSMTLEEVP